MVIFVLQQQSSKERWQWAKQTTDAGARGDSQVSAANYRRPGQLYTRCPAFKEGVETVLYNVLYTRETALFNYKVLCLR